MRELAVYILKLEINLIGPLRIEPGLSPFQGHDSSTNCRIFTFSGSRELNSDHLLPKQAYCHYTTPRKSKNPRTGIPPSYASPIQIYNGARRIRIPTFHYNSNKRSRASPIPTCRNRGCHYTTEQIERILNKIITHLSVQ